MAESLPAFSELRTEMSILETSQYLCSQLEKTKQSFRGLTEKFLTSKATAYTLANQLQKYKSHNDKKDENGQEPLTPRPSRGCQEEAVDEGQGDTRGNRIGLLPVSVGDSQQLPSTSSFPPDTQEASAAVAAPRKN